MGLAVVAITMLLPGYAQAQLYSTAIAANKHAVVIELSSPQRLQQDSLQQRYLQQELLQLRQTVNTTQTDDAIARIAAKHACSVESPQQSDSDNYSDNHSDNYSDNYSDNHSDNESNNALVTFNQSLFLGVGRLLQQELLPYPLLQPVKSEVFLSASAFQLDDPGYQYQYFLQDNAPPAYRFGNTKVTQSWEYLQQHIFHTMGAAAPFSDERTLIAVIDSGILRNNADFSDAARILPGKDFITLSSRALDGDGRDSNPNDECATSHGTVVAGIIGSEKNNGAGIVGIAPNSKILPLRAVAVDGTSVISDFIAALEYANTSAATITNVSLAQALPCTDLINTALAHAADNFIVWAAGNDFFEISEIIPGSCAGDHFVVGASDPFGTLTYYSNFGRRLDILAPGGVRYLKKNSGLTQSLTVLSNLSKYMLGYMQGTSVAAPHVAGVAALVDAVYLNKHNRPATPAELRGILQATSGEFNQDAVGLRCTTEYCGSGLLNAVDAVKHANSYDIIAYFPITELHEQPGATTQFAVALSKPARAALTITLRKNGYRHTTVHFATGESRKVVSVAVGRSNASYTMAANSFYITAGSRLQSLTIYPVTAATLVNKSIELSDPVHFGLLAPSQTHSYLLDIAKSNTRVTIATIGDELNVELKVELLGYIQNTVVFSSDITDPQDKLTGNQNYVWWKEFDRSNSRDSNTDNQPIYDTYRPGKYRISVRSNSGAAGVYGLAVNHIAPVAGLENLAENYQVTNYSVCAVGPQDAHLKTIKLLALPWWAVLGLFCFGIRLRQYGRYL